MERDLVPKTIYMPQRVVKSLQEQMGWSILEGRGPISFSQAALEFVLIGLAANDFMRTTGGTVSMDFVLAAILGTAMRSLPEEAKLWYENRKGRKPGEENALTMHQLSGRAPLSSSAYPVTATITQILQVAGIARDRAQGKIGWDELADIRRDAIFQVAQEWDVEVPTIADKYIRRLRPHSSGTEGFERLLWDMLNGGTKLKDVLLKVSRTDADTDAVRRFFEDPETPQSSPIEDPALLNKPAKNIAKHPVNQFYASNREYRDPIGGTDSVRLFFICAALSSDSQHHLDRTIRRPFDITAYHHEIGAETVTELAKRNLAERVGMWGETPGPMGVVKWEKLVPGDLVLVYVGGRRFGYVAELAAKCHATGLAKEAWGRDSEGRTWEFVYFLDKIKPISLSCERLNRFVGYKPRHFPAGSSFLSDDKAKALEMQYGSLRRAVSDLLGQELQ